MWHHVDVGFIELDHSVFNIKEINCSEKFWHLFPFVGPGVSVCRAWENGDQGRLPETPARVLAEGKNLWTVKSFSTIRNFAILKSVMVRCGKCL